MRKIVGLVLVVVLAVLLMGCGPDTIFVRPGLDTPDQHIAVGHKMIQRGKYDDACREFLRAKELMAPNYVKALVGLGLALGHKGALAEGEKAMEQAAEMAVSDHDKAEVQKGFKQLDALKLQQNQTPTTQ